MGLSICCLPVCVCWLSVCLYPCLYPPCFVVKIKLAMPTPPPPKPSVPHAQQHSTHMLIIIL